MANFHLMQELFLEFFYFTYGYIAEQPPGSTINDRDLLINRHRLILSLFQDLHVTDTLVKNSLGSRIQIGTKFGKGLQVPELGLVTLQRTGNFFHGFYLCVPTHT